MERRSLLRWSIVVMGAILPLTGATPASAYERPGDIQALSDPGGPSNSWGPSISADGRYVAFVSMRDDLVPNDTNEVSDIFVSDRETGEIERVSVASNGDEANNESAHPVMGPDGRYVAFSSGATNLAAGDSGGFMDTFIHDRVTGETEITSRPPGGPELQNISFPSEVSAGGRFALIETHADGLVSDDSNGFVDIFLVDRQTDTVEWISRPTEDVPRHGDAGSAAMSADGRFVAYGSIVQAEVLHDVPDLDANTTHEVLLLDRATGQRRILSRGVGGIAGNGFSEHPDISDDGRFVSFWSWANNLVPTDTNGVADIFVADTTNGRIERVSVSSIGEQANRHSQVSSLSPDGRYVAFTSGASTLVPGDTNDRNDIFLHDRELGTTERISTTSTGAQLAEGSTDPDVSAAGRYVAFTGTGTGLGGLTNVQDVFVRDRGPETGVARMTAERQGADVRVRGWASFSGGSFLSATDPGGDVEEAAAKAGGDLVGVSLAYGPEPRTVLVRIDLTDLPGTRAPQGDLTSPACNSFNCAPSASTGPGMLHGLRFDLDGVRHEIRISLGSISQPKSFAKYLLFRCDPECVSTQAYDGTYGITRLGLQLVMPLGNFTVANEPRFTNVSAFSAFGSADSGTVHPIDDMSLPNGSYVSTPSLGLAVGASDSAPPEAAFRPAALNSGRFDATVPAGSGASAVWARACHGSACSVSRIGV